MTLRIVQVPNPAAGHDWLTAVPGEWLYNVIGVTAELVTPIGGIPTTAADASGNGHNGTYFFNLATTPFVPGLVAGDLAVDFSQGNNGYSGGVDVPFAGINWAASFTIEFWTKDPGAGAVDNEVLGCQTGFGAPNVVVHVAAGPHPSITVQAFPGIFVNGPVDQPPGDGLRHHIVITSVPGPTVKLYVDGALIFTGAPGAPLAGTMNKTTIGGGAPTSPFSALIQDEVAMYATALSAARVAAHFAAAAVSFPTYTAAVLADAPLLYFHLDDALVGPGRQVCLEVTDGQHTVALVPTGFVELASGGPWLYSWQPGVQSNAETPAAGTFTVSIPDLILPAGYTIGTRTLDLAAGDQWTGILVWWNSDIMDALNPLNPYVFPPSVHLVYQQRTQPS